MKRTIAKLLSPVSSTRKTRRFFEVLYSFSLFGLFGDQWDFETNGEVRFLNGLPKILGTGVTLFDVGANKGGYTQSLLDIFKGRARIHGFEPARDIFTAYNEKFSGNDTVIKNNFGLGEREESLDLFKTKGASGLASIYADNKFKWDEKETIRLSTIDIYCAKAGVEKIDFLKIDVEGNELNVLKGASSMLQQDKIKVIQFEFGAGNIASRSFFADFYKMLDPRYDIFRIAKDGLIRIPRYDYKLEVFGRISNYACVHKSLSAGSK